MYIYKVFPVKGMIGWTRKYIVLFIIISAIPVFLFDILEWKWLHLPWLPIGLLGTAVAFIQGFKNNASYDRLWEARKIWGGIVNASRTWTIMIKDFINNNHANDPQSDETLSGLHKEFVKYLWKNQSILISQKMRKMKFLLKGIVLHRFWEFSRGD